MGAPIRLAFFIDDLGIGGTQTWLTILVRALATRGFEMRVFCMRAIFDQENVRRLREQAEVEIIGEGRLWAGIGLAHLARQLKSWPAEVVQTALPTSDMIGRTVARLAGVPAIFSTVRGRNVDKPRWQRWLDRRTAHWARAVVFNDRDAVPFSVRYEGIRRDQVVYIPNGVTLGAARQSVAKVRAELNTSPEAIVVGTIARLHPSKAQDTLLRAFARVCRHVPSAILWIIGEGELRTALEREADRLNVSDRVRMPGARHDTCDLLQAIDVFAMPSRWEGMPNALMEAMVAGRPVVASAIDGIRELVRHGETGWCIPADDVDALAQAIVATATDREAAARVGRAAAQHMQQNFSVDAMADAYAQLNRDGLQAAARR